MYAGDLAYAGLSTSMPRLNISKEDEFEHIWDLYAIQNQPIAATRPFMVCWAYLPSCLTLLPL